MLAPTGSTPGGGYAYRDQQVTTPPWLVADKLSLIFLRGISTSRAAPPLALARKKVSGLRKLQTRTQHDNRIMARHTNRKSQGS